jgi:hypothetical protein
MKSSSPLGTLGLAGLAFCASAIPASINAKELQHLVGREADAALSST